MNVFFENRRLEKLCTNMKVAKRDLGAEDAERLETRMVQLDAAECLADMLYMPGARLHELSNNREGQLALDLKHPRRLILIPADEPTPRKPDGGYDLDKITTVKIIEVGVDYHGK